MKTKLVTTIVLLTLLSMQANTQVSMDSLENLIAQQKNFQLKSKIVSDKILNLSKTDPRVQVLQTCSTRPEDCGVIVTGSGTLIKILDGKYIGDTLLIVATCQRTMYEVNKIYRISMASEPFSNVLICSGITVNLDWNLELDKNRYFIFFGRLVKSV